MIWKSFLPIPNVNKACHGTSNTKLRNHPKMPFRSLTAFLSVSLYFSVSLCGILHTSMCPVFFLSWWNWSRAAQSRSLLTVSQVSPWISYYFSFLPSSNFDIAWYTNYGSNGEWMETVLHCCRLFLFSIFCSLSIYREEKRKSTWWCLYFLLFLQLYKIQRLVHNDVKRKAVNALIHKAWTNMSLFLAIFWSVMYFY